MKSVESVHGTFTSFSDLASAMGMKQKKKEEKEVKCPNCGGHMTCKGGGNVFYCELCKLVDKTLKDGTPVQIFSPCDTYVTLE